jgi:hypothetical protein
LSAFLISVIFTVASIAICIFIGIRIENKNPLRGEQQTGVIIINENQYRFDGPDAFKAAIKEIRLSKYEHIIIDGVDYFIYPDRCK